MKGEERRKQLLNILSSSNNPISGGTLSKALNVSRQIIVQDISLLRANGATIFSTNKGYLLQEDRKYSRVFKVYHTDDQVEEELSTIVDAGGQIRDVFVYHKVYGVLKADMGIKSRRDIRAYMEEISTGKSSLLKNVTSGYHYHTIDAESEEILDAIQDVLGGDRFQEYADLKGLPKIDAQRVVTTGGHYEYLKIAEGCDKHCTYCIIPKLRGPYRSVPMEELIAEAKTMAEQGVKELVLVAQETTIYGIDLYGKPSLHLLLKELCKIQELYWIRILYCYPEDIYPELVQTMKEEPKVCHYLDLPIQHANDEILRRMGRRTSKQELIDKIDFLRSEMPDITLRTTLITGFPGETKEQHKELLEFINDMEFDRLGVFTYSPEEGTPAAAMEHQIDEEVKLDRQAELMELQQDISAELGERRIGQELLVMIEGKVADEDAYVGRSQADAPGVDGYVFVNTPETLVSGDFVRVKITGALEYDLIGEISQ